MFEILLDIRVAQAIAAPKDYSFYLTQTQKCLLYIGPIFFRIHYTAK